MKNVASQLSTLSDTPTRYEQRFGALPFWLDEVPTNCAQALLKQALQRGVPLTAADDFH